MTKGVVKPTWGIVSEADCQSGSALDKLTAFGAAKNNQAYVPFDAVPKGGKFANPDDV